MQRKRVHYGALFVAAVLCAAPAWGQADETEETYMGCFAARSGALVANFDQETPLRIRGGSTEDLYLTTYTFFVAGARARQQGLAVPTEQILVRAAEDMNVLADRVRARVEQGDATILQQVRTANNECKAMVQHALPTIRRVFE